MAKVRSMFLPHEAEVILGIPISFRMPEDTITWAWTLHGKFTIKSAYMVAQKWLKEDLRRPDGGGSLENLGMKSI